MKAQIILLYLLAACVHAQVRYQFGDDAKWADPKFDDSAWPIAAPDKFPTPAFESDGMLWLRYRVPVPIDASPLAVRLAREDMEGIPDEVWVNGTKVGSHGKFPPHPDVRTRYTTVVFDLPPGLVTPGEIAHVAWRAWFPPVFSGVTTWSQLQPFGVEIGSRSFMRTREQNAIAGARIAVSLTVLINVLVLILGVCVFALWIATRGARVLLWFSLFVIFWASGLLASQLSFWPPEWTYAVFWIVWCLNSVALNVAVNEFMDAAFDVPRWAIRTLEAVGIVWPLLFQLPGLVVTPYAQVAAAGQLSIFLFGVWVVGQTVLTFWVLVRGPRETRALAATFAIWNVKLFASDVTKIVPLYFEWRGQRLDTDTLVLLGVIVTMCWLLLRRTWKDWLAKEELGAEFDAARAMQARLVPPAVDVPGYRVESAYYPARHVGGDFFRIMPAENGSVLVVVGDVSGKGLGAAMTVAALAGALDNEFSRSPGEVLEHLNRALLQRKGEGFVTCCAALLERSGKIRIANAGHLSPYAGGAELSVEAALPLGVVDGVTYAETLLQIGEGEGLTFLSDGVVEAANSAGELFGFERTREISVKAANEIAEAAKAWGQNDDITVVSVRLMEVIVAA